MKFERNNLNANKVASVLVEETPVLAPENITEPAPVEETPIEVAEVSTPVVEEVVQPVVAPVEAPTPEPAQTIEEKYKIPEFEPKVRPNGFTRVQTAPAPTPIPTVAAEDVKSVEAVDEVPAGEPVQEGVEIVGDLAPEVQEQLDALSSAPVEEPAPEVPQSAEVVPEAVPEWTGNCEQCGALEHLCTCDAPIPDAPPVEEAPEPTPTEETASDVDQTEEPTAAVAWKKFVDFVIIPTLMTCIDKFKEYITDVLSADLKKSNPDVK